MDNLHGTTACLDFFLFLFIPPWAWNAPKFFSETSGLEWNKGIMAFIYVHAYTWAYMHVEFCILQTDT